MKHEFTGFPAARNDYQKREIEALVLLIYGLKSYLPKKKFEIYYSLYIYNIYLIYSFIYFILFIYYLLIFILCWYVHSKKLIKTNHLDYTKVI